MKYLLFIVYLKVVKKVFINLLMILKIVVP